jgi:hypothetical protein
MRNGGDAKNQKMAFFFNRFFSICFSVCCLVCISGLIFVKGSVLVVALEFSFVECRSRPASAILGKQEQIGHNNMGDESKRRAWEQAPGLNKAEKCTTRHLYRYIEGTAA